MSGKEKQKGETLRARRIQEGQNVYEVALMIRAEARDGTPPPRFRSAGLGRRCHLDRGRAAIQRRRQHQAVCLRRDAVCI